MDKTKLKTLAEYLDCNMLAIKQGWNESTFELGNQEYLVLTDDEAYQSAEDYIKDSVWAFNPSFLAEHTGIDEGIFEALQDKCEDVNELITNSIKDIDEFIADAISQDGIAHFISTYDGAEEELNDFYIYRTN